MKAIYYCIKDIDTNIVDEGIVTDSESTIYPGQNSDIDELPYECPLHHFKVKGYDIESWEIKLTRDDVRKLKVN